MLLHMIYYDDWFLSKIQTNSIVFKRISNKMAFAIKNEKKTSSSLLARGLLPLPPMRPEPTSALAQFSLHKHSRPAQQELKSARMPLPLCCLSNRWSPRIIVVPFLSSSSSRTLPMAIDHRISDSWFFWRVRHDPRPHK